MQRILRGILDRINKLVIKFMESLPAYQWVNCLSQLISRIAHRNASVSDILNRTSQFDASMCANQ